MSVNLRRYLVSMFGFEHVVRLVPASAWGNSSPCENWTASDVVGHAMAVVNNIASRGGVGESLNPFGDRPGDNLGDDPLAAWTGARNRLLEAVDQQGVLQREITSTLGPMTLDAYIGLMVADTTIHTWDLARAAGVDERLDPELVGFVHEDLIRRDSPDLRGPARYAPATAAEGLDAQTALLRFAGRNP